MSNRSTDAGSFDEFAARILGDEVLTGAAPGADEVRGRVGEDRAGSVAVIEAEPPMSPPPATPDWPMVEWTVSRRGRRPDRVTIPGGHPLADGKGGVHPHRSLAFDHWSEWWGPGPFRCVWADCTLDLYWMRRVKGCPAPPNELRVAFLDGDAGNLRIENLVPMCRHHQGRFYGARG
ncbi:MAG: hypothetical protein AAFZ07_25740 [Actinomycetota bacterium]